MCKTKQGLVNQLKHVHVLEQTCRTGGQKITSLFSKMKQKPKSAVIESKDSDQLASEEEIFEEPMQSKPAQARSA